MNWYRTLTGLRSLHRCYTTASLPTIYALSTPVGSKSAIAIVRVSGSQVGFIYNRLTGHSLARLPPRRASLRNLYECANPQSDGKTLLDSALVLYFPHPNSFTGEDLMEFHLHGGRAIINSVMNSIQSLNDKNGVCIRYAQAGEFSQRAFQNGKFDLTEVESINALIDAETETQRKSLMSSFTGHNRRLFVEWRDTLVKNIGQLTAIIDFADDNDISGTASILATVEDNVVALREEVRGFLETLERSNLLVDGIKLVLFGSPNVGKSWLLNRLTNDDETAIVSEIPGTTRDSIDSVVNLEGYKVVLCDTAGIRDDSVDTIEQIGIDRARKKVSRGDICLLVVDATRSPIVDPALIGHLSDNSNNNTHQEVIVVLNKTDLLLPGATAECIQEVKESFKSHGLALEPTIVAMSCKSKEGLEELMESLVAKLRAVTELRIGAEPTVMSRRVQDILQNDVLAGIDGFLEGRAPQGTTDSKDDDVDVVMACENLRYSVEGIGKILGEAVGVEEILDVVFSSFCIGK